MDALPAGALDELLADPTRALINVLTSHGVFDEKLVEADLAVGVSVETVKGEKISMIVGMVGRLWVNDIEVIRADLGDSNDVVRICDGAPIPPED